MWRIEIENWKSVDIAAANTIFTEANKYLMATHEVAEKITNRAFNIFVILVPVFSLTFGYLFYLKQSNGYVNLIYAVGLLVVVGCSYFLFQVIFPFSFHSPGRKPKELFLSQFFSLNANEQNLAIVLNEIETCQLKIEHNENINSKRLRTLRNVLVALGSTALVTVVATIMSVWYLL